MKPNTKRKALYNTPFNQYFRMIDQIDRGKHYTDEFGSIMIIGLIEEVGEMARAYLAKHGRKRTNLAAQTDETYTQELGDLMLMILRFARLKKINLHERLMYSLEKIMKRQKQPKVK